MTAAPGPTGWSYDNRGRVNGVGGPAGGFGYGYDRAGNLTSISPGNLNYMYDALNRLSMVSAQVGGNRPTVASYGYGPEALPFREGKENPNYPGLKRSRAPQRSDNIQQLL